MEEESAVGSARQWLSVPHALTHEEERAERAVDTRSAIVVVVRRVVAAPPLGLLGWACLCSYRSELYTMVGQ